MTTAIVTDSTSDIPGKILQDLSIFQIPVDLTLDGITYRDGFDLSRNDFYRKLPGLKNLPTTAAPSAGRFKELFLKILDEGYSEIISIHASSLLSGIFNSARLAAEEFTESIQVFDSEQLSMGLGFQVIQAAKYARDGLGSDQILPKIRSILTRSRVFAMLDTFEYIHRSGRVSWAKARLGSVLQIKPVLELTGGEVLNRGAVRTRRKGIQHLAEILQNIGVIEHLAILHTNAEDDGQKFLNQYSPNNITTPLLVNVTTIIGTHVGPNGLGFAAVVK